MVTKNNYEEIKYISHLLAPFSRGTEFPPFEPDTILSFTVVGDAKEYVMVSGMVYPVKTSTFEFGANGTI